MKVTINIDHDRLFTSAEITDINAEELLIISAALRRMGEDLDSHPIDREDAKRMYKEITQRFEERCINGENNERL